MLKWLVCDEVSNLLGRYGRTEITYEANVDTSDTATTVVLDTLDHLVDDLGGVSLQTSSHLKGVSPALGVFSSNTLKGNIRTTVLHLLQGADNSLALGQVGEVDGLNVGELGLAVVETPVLVDDNNTLGAVHVGEVNAHLTDGTGTPDGNDITLLDSGIDNTVPAGADYIGQVETLLIRDVVGKVEKVDITTGHTSVLSLTTSETTSEVRVAEHTGGAATVHGILDCVGVGLLTLR
jgi:hypothetical protein